MKSTNTSSLFEMVSVPFAIVMGVFALAGCQQPVPALTSNANSAVAKAGGLEFMIELPNRQFVVGQQVSVALTALNTTTTPMEIQADSQDLVLVQIWDETLVGWEKVKEYPQVRTMVSTPWRLGALQRRTWHMNLTVEPDWPTAKRIRMTALLNGRPDTAATVLIQVAPQN